MVSRLGWSGDERGLGVRKQEIKTRGGIKRRKGEKETHRDTHAQRQRDS